MSYFGDISITYHEVGSNDLMENNNYFIFNKKTKRAVLFFLFGILLIILSIIGIELYRRKSTNFQDNLVNNTFPTTISTSQSSSLSPQSNKNTLYCFSKYYKIDIILVNNTFPTIVLTNQSSSLASESNKNISCCFSK
jgi:adenine specific DNA methylase Mod